MIDVTRSQIARRRKTNANSFASKPLLTIGLMIAVAAIGGCGGRAAVQNDLAVSGSDPASQAAARKILGDVVQAYAEASEYHDDAKIVVRYRLDGRPMEEHQLWAIDFKRPNLFAARLFNTRLQSDQNRTTAMVFDFDSENMDNQYLVLESPSGPPWAALFGDPICRHFISGSSEIPFDSQLANELNLPPTIGLLFGEPQIDWLLAPEQIELLADGELEDRVLRRLRIVHDHRQYELWIDPQTNLCLQAILPNQFLDAALLISPEITSLQLSLQFTGATFEPQRTSSPFSTELPETANAVSQFVPLPDPFPSECIGNPLPPIALTDATGNQSNWAPSPKPTIVAWVDRQDRSIELIRHLEAITSRQNQQALDVQLCLVELVESNPDAPFSSDLAQYIHDSGCRFSIASDIGLIAGSALGVKFAPTVMVVDASGVVQFFDAGDSADGSAKLATALDRISNGENIAREMRTEYSKFVDEYQSKLRRFNPLASDSPTTAPSLIRDSSTAPRMPEAMLWKFSDVKLPGNIVSHQPGQILVNDGWQSVIELDVKSQRAQVHALNLDREMSVTTLRPFAHAESQRFAAFAEMGRQVVALDLDGLVVAKYSTDPDAQVKDVQVSDGAGSGNGDPKIWVLDTNSSLQSLDHTLSGPMDKIQLESADSFIAIPSTAPEESKVRFLVVRSDGGLVAITDELRPQTPFTFGSLKIKRLFSATNTELLACATALDEHGQWVAVGIDRQLEVAWKCPIGPQEFDRQIQPIACVALDAGHSLWAFAASDRSIAVIDGQGILVEVLQWQESIHGIALIKADDVLALIIADPAAVTAFPTRAAPMTRVRGTTAAMPASNSDY